MAYSCANLKRHSSFHRDPFNIVVVDTNQLCLLLSITQVELRLEWLIELLIHCHSRTNILWGRIRPSKYVICKCNLPSIVASLQTFWGIRISIFWAIDNVLRSEHVLIFQTKCLIFRWFFSMLFYLPVKHDRGLPRRVEVIVHTATQVRTRLQHFGLTEYQFEEGNDETTGYCL